MAESEYDAFGTGHSSTSISAALGMATASALTEDNGRLHIAVIGDGAMTGGMAMEAMNNAGVSNANLLVILNDNGIAIDKNVGAIKESLAVMISSKTYNKIKDKIWLLLGGGTKYGKNTRAIVKQIGNAVKSTILKRSNLFESLNFRYFGPIDGNDVVHLSKILRDLQRIQGPKLLHIVTTKGKGFEVAEKNQTTFHSPGTFDRKTGKLTNHESLEKQAPKYQTVFGKTIIELAKKNDKIVGITPAMPTGCSLNLMMEVMPERVFDVGIAEQHAVTFAAGLAMEGMRPVVSIYSTFMQRALDQIIHDVCLPDLPVTFALDRGGVVGDDGPTHHGVFDLSFLRFIPNLTVMAPKDENELQHMLYTSITGDSPCAIRYPRGSGEDISMDETFTTLPLGRAELLRAGNDVLLLPVGNRVYPALEAAEGLAKLGIDAAVINPRFIKPLDNELIGKWAKTCGRVVTVEDNVKKGGFGSAVLQMLHELHLTLPVRTLGYGNKFIDQAPQKVLWKNAGIDAAGIIKGALEVLKQ